MLTIAGGIILGFLGIWLLLTLVNNPRLLKLFSTLIGLVLGICAAGLFVLYLLLSK